MRSRTLLRLCSFLLCMSALLYGAPSAGATEGAAPKAGRPAPHIALLLPIGSPSFGVAAEAVRQGFDEAAKRHPAAPLPVRAYPISEDPQHVLAGYRDALAGGAALVVGPLTRAGVTALASSDLVKIPTLALNVPDGAPQAPTQFYALSLQVEAEAQQIAHLALSQGHRRAITVSDPTPLSTRMRVAFVAEFERRGGYHIAAYAYATDPGELERLRKATTIGVADLIFLALDFPRARALRPYTSALPAYGTSQLNPGITGTAAYAELGELRFVDMPWLLQPDHPAVMLYERPAYQDAPDLERLYALGIDAYRIAQDLLARRETIALDGVTGRLVLGSDRHFRRGLPVGLVSAGRLQVLGEARP
jgi:uncharacterized protein